MVFYVTLVSMQPPPLRRRWLLCTERTLESRTVFLEKLVNRHDDFIVVESAMDKLGRVQNEKILVRGGHFGTMLE